MRKLLARSPAPTFDVIDLAPPSQTPRLGRPPFGITPARPGAGGLLKTAPPMSTADDQRVIFCRNCGTIMEQPSLANTNVQCRMCGTQESFRGA